MKDKQYYIKKHNYFHRALLSPSCRGFRDMCRQAILYCLKKIAQIDQAEKAESNRG
jgi:hypothetical protein